MTAAALKSVASAGAKARPEMEKALAVGIRDAVSFYRAGVIARRCGDEASAERYMRLSLKTNERSEVADAVRKELGMAHTGSDL